MHENEHLSPVVVLLGVAGSGKGTQAALLEQRFGFVKVDAGDVVRQTAKQETELGRQAKAISDSGRHMPDEMIGTLMREYMRAIPVQKALVIDGFPRTVGQDDILHRIFRDLKLDARPLHPIWIKVDMQNALDRLLNRSICQSCKTIFASRDIKTCPICGGQVLPRVDDTPEAIKRRFAFFEEGPMKAIHRYQSNNHLHTINGDQTVEQVHADIVKAIMG